MYAPENSNYTLFSISNSVLYQDLTIKKNSWL